MMSMVRIGLQLSPVKKLLCQVARDASAGNETPPTSFGNSTDCAMDGH